MKEVKEGMKNVRKRSIQNRDWGFSILKEWESGLVLHPMYRLNDIINTRSKQQPVNYFLMCLPKLKAQSWGD